ncbi:hypothetical protein McPS_21140 [Marichromatium sp. PS1]|uniref:hypothetical protein n=1 Tax=Marichromatium sp. PS1 TaxID=3138932 RepID=UPI0032E7D76A
MHIDDLINKIRPLIPFGSEQAAQAFIDSLGENDPIALISAMYIGRSHINSNEINDDYKELLFSGKIDRFWDEDTVPENEIARVLHEKNKNLNIYYDAFMRCTTNSNFDRSNF